MFGFEHRPIRAAAAAAVIAVGAAACDDPLQPIDVPQVDALRIFMVLDPDEDTQMMLVEHTAGELLTGLRGVVVTEGREIASDAVPPDRSVEERLPCLLRYAGVLVEFPRCLTLPFTPEYGASYDVRVSASERPDASATTTVPGDFRIVSHKVSGSPPGTGGLNVTWTRSSGVFRYVVAIRGEKSDNCAHPTGCFKRWFATTTDTTLAATISDEYFERAGGPWHLDVYAMNKDVFTHLMTGAAGTFFPVAPAQNVSGGFGAVGAWVRRSVALPEAASSR